jgi:hypothetical protein
MEKRLRILVAMYAAPANSVDPDYHSGRSSKRSGHGQFSQSRDQIGRGELYRSSTSSSVTTSKHARNAPRSRSLRPAPTHVERALWFRYTGATYVSRRRSDPPGCSRRMSPVPSTRVSWQW